MEIQIDCTFYLVTFALVVLDFVTGTAAAFCTNSYNSSKMREGLMHKFSYLLVIIFALLADWLLVRVGIEQELGDWIVTLVLVWVCFTEVFSFIENVVRINPELATAPFFRYFTSNESIKNFLDGE